MIAGRPLAGARPAVAWFATDPTGRGLWLPIGLLAGGAIGNLIDRIRDGAVTDFIDPPRWPAFNVADIAITLGVVLVIYLLRAERQRCRRGEPSATADRPRRDEQLAVVDKPAGLLVHPAPGTTVTTLVDALERAARRRRRPERPGIVHRLDQDTSGLLVVARTREAHAALTAR